MMGTALSLLLLGASAWWALTQRRSVQQVSAVALVVSLLASPLAWIHYTLFLLPVICWLWPARGLRLFVACVIVPVPLLVDQISRGKLLLLSVGSTYNWALILLLGIVIAGRPGETQHESRRRSASLKAHRVRPANQTSAGAPLVI